MTQGVLLVGHGSRHEAGNGQFLRLAAEVAERLPGTMLEPCFLDHAAPAVPEGIARLVERGASRVGVVPLFLFAAGHARRDVPDLVLAAQATYDDVRFRCGRVLGVHPAMVGACAAALEAAEGAGSGDRAATSGAPGNRADTAVLLVGRGSSHPDANAGLCTIARLLYEATGYGLVECAYSDVTRPTVPDGLDRCLRLGARRVVLLPYFLFRGVLMDRLQALTATWQERHPDRTFLMAGAGGLAQYPGVLDLAVARAAETLG